MEKITRLLELDSCSLQDLPETYQSLVSDAESALERSHSPYSNFAVGCAVLLESGAVVSGANQENAAYPSGLCAERVALFSAGFNYPNDKVVAIAVAIAEPLDKWPFPCGACLQVMSETRERQAQELDILMKHPLESKVLWSKGLVNLLPFAFSKDYLEQ